MSDLGSFVPPLVRSTTHRTTDELLNEVCRRHPAILDSVMSEHGVGLDVEVGKYCISLNLDFECHIDKERNEYGWESGWIEANTAEEMLALIGTIRIKHFHGYEFGATPLGDNKPGKTTWTPRYTDEQLNITRNPDGSIALRDV